MLEAVPEHFGPGTFFDSFETDEFEELFKKAFGRSIS